MKTIGIFIIVLSSIVTLSCNKSDDAESNDTDYLIFGHFYGMCMGEECVETYKLTDSKLFEDTKDLYFSTQTFDFVHLENDKFELVKDLPNFFPNQLMDENENTFGCPDCADQGGLFIQISKDGNVHSWKIDQSKNNVPGYMHNFMDKLNEKIELINK